MKKNQIILIIIGVLVLIGLISSFIYWLQFVKPKTEVSTPALTSEEEAEDGPPSLPGITEPETSIFTPIGEEPIGGGLGKPPQLK